MKELKKIILSLWIEMYFWCKRNVSCGTKFNNSHGGIVI